MAWLILWCFLHCVFLCVRAATPNVTSPNSVINRVKGGINFELSCTVEAPSTSISWYWNNIPVQRQASAVCCPLSSTLSLTSITRADSGWYTCRASNVDGYSYKDFLVAVGAAPTMSVQPAALSTTRGTTVPFACLAEGIPAPFIQWFRNDMPGQALPSCSSTSVGDVCVDDTADFQLVVNVTTMTTANDLRFYCSATNEFGMVNSSRIRITALSDPQGNKIPPPSNLALFYRASPNEQVQLECIGAGTNIIVSWSHNGVDLSQNTSSITVQGADTRGVYCCRLRSSGRTSDLLTSYCTYILPQSKPVIVTSPPSLVTAEVGRSICLVCDADGVNDPEVIWMRGADTLQSHSGDRYNITADRDNVRLSHFVVLDTASSDTGSYQCSAQNFISNATKDFQISVVSRSDANSNLLRDPGAEVSSSGGSPWEYQTRNMTAQKAMKINVAGENVFEISYRDAMAVDDLYIRQSFMIPANVTAVQMSARMHQNATSAPAYPLLTLQVADNISHYLKWDDPIGLAWQWAAMNITLGVSQSGMDLNATVVMSVTLAMNVTLPNGVVYFDDISVVPLSFVAPTTVDDNLLLIVKIAVPSGGVLLLVAIVVVVACCCCYYCGCCKRHNDAEPMRKETMRQRFSKWTTRYRASNRPVVDGDEANSHQHYTPLQAVGPESVYTRPGKDGPLYASLARAGGNSSVSGEGVTSSGESKEYYYIQQPASVPERNVSSASIIGTSTFLQPPPPPIDKSGSQSSLASRELPPAPNMTDGTITDNQELTENYLQLVPATSPPVSGGKEEVTTDVDAKFAPTVEDPPNMETTAAAEMYYTNDSVGPQISRPPMDRQPTYDQVYVNEEEGTRKSHPPMDRQPTYDKVYANEEVAENGHPPVGQQPTYENTDSVSFSRPVLRHQPTSEEVYVVVT